MKRTILQAAAVMMLASTLTSCGNNQKGNEHATEDALTANLGQYVATSTTDNPAIFLSLVNSTETDSSIVYVGKSLNDTDTLGLQIEITKDIPGGVFEDGNVNEEKAFHEGAIKFSSIGEASDRFVKAVATLYEQPVDGGMTDAILEPLVFSSNKTAVDLTGNGTYAFKLFFANSIGEEAEVFAELNLYNRSFKMWAKDADQYPRILSAFTGGL
ncbi:hypothetical protein H8B06_02395 [Sphingobacterium sp. DN00404]|uniref:Uncharacterized protein n=1 Tax=Sphingobacterium micropteri TaxID=2763501 RepID=A0ABR7YKA1_9SPHI|nr:hypothetical protein [Sphingobacterium micropteri]MBD1431661.1 hypothetical protein [Sphingobacterium micropteri]